MSYLLFKYVLFTSPLNTTSFQNGVSVGVARELAVNGSMNNVLASSATTFDVITATNGYPGGTGYALAGFAVAEVA